LLHAFCAYTRHEGLAFAVLRGGFLRLRLLPEPDDGIDEGSDIPRPALFIE